MTDVERKPIYINDHTMLLIASYHRTNDMYDMLSLDSHLKNYPKDIAVAAKNLIDSISDMSSIHFLQHLRKAIADEIDERNKERNAKPASYDLEDDDD